MDIQGVLHARGPSRVIDLSRAEKEGKYFEGTGALVLDRINGIAYVSLSERADRQIAEHWVQRLGYKVCQAQIFNLHSRVIDCHVDVSMHWRATRATALVPQIACIRPIIVGDYGEYCSPTCKEPREPSLQGQHGSFQMCFHGCLSIVSSPCQAMSR